MFISHSSQYMLLSHLGGVCSWLIDSLVLAPCFFCLPLSQCKVQFSVHTEAFDLELEFEVESKQLMISTPCIKEKGQVCHKQE